MKKILLLLFVAANLSCQSQNLAPKELNNTELNNFIGNIDDYQKYTLNDNLIKIIIIKNPSGSAKTEETDEVSSNLYISKCEFGELTICKLYVVENIFNISVEKVYEDKNNIIIGVRYGNFNHSKVENILIPLN